MAKTPAKAIILLLFSLCTYTIVIAQNIKKNKKPIFDNQLRISLSPILYDKLEINNTGKNLLKSYNVFSGELAISYYKHLWNNFGINIGAGFNIAPYYIDYHFTAPKNSIFYNSFVEHHVKDFELGDLRDYVYLDYMYVFPLSIQKTFTAKNGKIFNIEAGIKLNRLLNDSYIISSDVDYEINDTLDAKLFKYFIQGNKKNYYSYFIKAGLIKITKKYNTLHLNFVLNYSPQKIGTGEYKFYNLPFDSYGKLKQNINYIGFEFAYGLSMTKNYKIKKTKKTILDNQIKFSLLPIVYKKIKFFHYGVELLKSDPGFGGEATISYSKHLKNNLCLNIGLGFNLQPYSIYYNFEAPENSIFSEYKNLKLSKNYTDYMLVFPLSLQKIITSKNGHLFSLEAGIKFNKVLNSPHLGKICDIYENKTLFDITYYETKKNLYSIFIKAGMIKLKNNNNTLHLNIILNYSPQKIESCDYEFYNLPYESCGVIENKINYIGIEFAYGLNLF